MDGYEIDRCAQGLKQFQLILSLFPDVRDDDTHAV